ncbi:TGACG-sequence-specific DNA-binding protein TGA-2.1 [Hordeum vulgare]|nr:TGACG-sequence-specific DNA-binding protein TGA-2.1 [Hordeum vulgare]
MLTKTLEAKKELAEKKARDKQEKWQLLNDKGLPKAPIEEGRVFAVETKAMAKLLVKENKIMTLKRDDMDDITKEWHDMTRRDTLKRRMVAATRGCFGVGDVFPSGIGTSAAIALMAMRAE